MYIYIYFFIYTTKDGLLKFQQSAQFFIMVKKKEWWKKHPLKNERFGNHKRDFKHPKYRNSTELSKYIWKLKDANLSVVTEWSIVRKVLPKTQSNFCKLFLFEKFYIIKSLNGPNLLNKKSELVNACRHQSKLLLKSFKRNRYSERSDTTDWYLVFDICSSILDVSVCWNIFSKILTYSSFQNSILLCFWSIQHLPARAWRCFIV